jgi:hypothetical protein
VALDPRAQLESPGPWSWAPDEWSAPADPLLDLNAPPDAPPLAPDPWPPPALTGAPVELATPTLPPPPEPGDLPVTPPPPPGVQIVPDIAPPPWARPTIEAKAGATTEREIPELEAPEGTADIAPIAEGEPVAAGEGEEPAEIEFTEQDALDARVADLVELHPEEFARQQMLETLRQESERSRLQLEDSERQRSALEANVARREQAKKQAQADLADITTRAKEMADASPFESWWETRSAPQKFAGYLAAIFGGFLANKTGRNAAIDMFMKLADDDANQKWASIRERRATVADQMAQADDDFRTRESIRLAAAEQVARGIEAQIAQLNPQGTQALRLAETLRGVRARQAEMAAAAEQVSFDRADKMIAADQKQQEIDLKVYEAQERSRLARIKAAAAAAGARAKPADVVYDPSYYAAQGLPTPPMPMDDKGYDKWLMRQKDAGVLAKNDAERAEATLRQAREKRERTVQFVRPVVTRDADGRVTGRRFEQLIQPNDGQEGAGQPFEVVDPTSRKEIETKLEVATQLIASIDRVQELRNLHGSEMFKTGAWREAQANFADALTNWKDQKGLGALSGADFELAAKALGTEDPNELRAIDRGLQEARKVALRNLNTSLNRVGFRGTYNIPNLTSQGQQEAADRGPAGQKVRDVVEQSRKKWRNLRIADEGGTGRRGVDILAKGPDRYAVTRSERAVLDDLVERAAAGDDSASAGLATLAQDRKLGPRVQILLAQSDLDLSDRFSEEAWNEIAKAREIYRAANLKRSE